MSERQGSPERIVRLETGLVTYSHPYFAEMALRERRAIRFAEEPLFALREYPVISDREGARQLTKELHDLLDDDEAAALRLEDSRIVARGNFAELTDGMEPGEIRRISADEYLKASRIRYGNVIQGPFIF